MADGADDEVARFDTATADVIAGRYELHERLGWGECSEVWSATDRVLGREVAVKRLLPHLLDDPRRAERFRREAIALARVNHPGVIAVFDTVATPNCQAIVMELIHGDSLRAHLDTVGMLDPGEVIDIGIALFEALGAAHRQGLIHRDVTPANILLGEDSSLRLSDFGLAQFADTSVTLTGSMTGTAPYVAPEQVEGAPLDPRCDVYSASAVLFEAACGVPPFLRSTDAATMLARLREPPPDPRAIRPALSIELAQVLLTGLARHPADRYTDALAAAAELRAASLAMHRVPTPATVASMPAPAQVGATGRTASTRPSSMITVQQRAGSGSEVVHQAPNARPLRDATPSMHANSAAATRSKSFRQRTHSVESTPTPAASSRRRPPRSASRRSVATAAALLVAGAALLVVALVQPDTNPTTRPAEAAPPISSVEFTAVTTLDPEGTGAPGENDQRADRLIDGDPDSSWITERYLDQRFGTKPGVGFAIQLAADTALVDMTIASRSQDWRAEVSVVNQLPKGVPAPGRVIEGGTGETIVDLRGMQGSVIIVWITQLGLGSGGYSVEWSEIRATGRS